VLNFRPVRARTQLKRESFAARLRAEIRRSFCVGSAENPAVVLQTFEDLVAGHHANFFTSLLVRKELRQTEIF
jgi:hypothetical protein